MVAGHLLLAPVAGFWTSALLGFFLMCLHSVLRGRGNWDPNLFYCAFGPYGGNFLLFGVIGIIFSVAVAYAFGSRHPWAPRMAVALALTCLASIVNAAIWLPPDAYPAMASPVFWLPFAASALWFAYVLFGNREVWRPPSSVRGRDTR